LFSKDKSRIQKFWQLPFILPLINMIALTGSRVTFLTLMISLIVFFVLRRTNRSSSRIFVLLIGAIIIYFLIDYLLQFDVLRLRLLTTLQDQNISGRDKIWEIILPELLDNLFIGMGISGYIDYSYRVFSRFVSPHNVFIEVLAYSGLIGLFTYLLFFWKLGIYSFKSYLARGILLPLIFIMAIFFINVSGQALNVKIFWMLFIYSISISNDAYHDVKNTYSPIYQRRFKQ
ncbi:MAG: O-antigen ligase family protein, partial [Bacteroidales bacterium]|nr:O-antigen ligase family protein [Bacteroidales bacterium]